MDQKEFETALANVEGRLKRLRVLYDQWFMGIERVEPQAPRLDLERMIARMRAVHVRNTALRFRFGQLLQRYMAYTTYWKRVTRQIEEGTYKRDVLRARRLRRGAGSGDASPRGQDAYEVDLDAEIDVDIESALDSVMQSSKPPPPPAGKSSWPPPVPDKPSGASREITPFALPGAVAAPPLRAFPPPRSPTPPAPAQPSGNKRPPPPPPPRAVTRRANGVSDDQIQTIFNRYVQARASNAERTDNVRIETIAKSVREMMPKLEQKHAGKKIEFEVVVRNGKVALKPVPK
jgi:hypothetical protein